MSLNENDIFTVSSGALFASDPCYHTRVTCTAKIENVLNGEWTFLAYKGVGAAKGRIIEFHATHTECLNRSGKWEKLPKTLGVDSGQFGFFDYEYFKAHENEREYDKPGFYNSACKITLSNELAGIVGGQGCVSSSGWGDGSYPVYVVRNAFGEVIAVKVMFDEYIDEEDEYGCDYSSCADED